MSRQATKQTDAWIGRRIGKYQVQRVLGSGGMGAVFAAIHKGIGRQAAIKILHPRFAQDSEIVARFLNEARAANRIRHPGIVDIYEVGQTPDGVAYIVMEYLEGEPLSARLKRVRSLGAAAVRLARQIASALAVAHGKGVIHRDLKPANVMLVKDPEAPGGERTKVLDFGIAKIAEDAEESLDPEDLDAMAFTTRTGQLMGTPIYMAPEQCRGAGTVTAKADVYALGIMLYQSLCGTPPFVAVGAGNIIAMHLGAQPRPLREMAPNLPDRLVELVHLMLAKDPAQRPTMDQAAILLDHLDTTRATALLAPVGPVPTPRSMGALTGSNGPALQAPVTGRVLAGRRQVSPAAPFDAGPSSTLRQLSGESGIAMSRSRMRLVFLLTAATAGLGAAIFGLRSLQSGPAPYRPVQQVAVTPPPVQAMPPQVTQVRWFVASEPQGAQVLSAGDQRLLGMTPWDNTQPASTGTLTIVLRSAGYMDRRLVLDLSRDVNRTERLVRKTESSPPRPRSRADDRARQSKGFTNEEVQIIR